MSTNSIDIPVTPVVRLPRSYVPCPLCGKHYVFPGRESRLFCNRIED